MADNVGYTPGAGATIATDDVGGVQFQKNKLDLGGDGVSSPLVRGQQTKANSLPVTLASDQDNVYTEGNTDATITGTPILWEDAADTLRAVSAAKPLPAQLSDGTSLATVRNLAANDALNVAIVDGSGNQVTSFGGSGGTSSTDDADFTPLSTSGTPVMGVREDSPSTVTDGDMGVIGIDASRNVKVNLTASALDVAHDAVDSGQPVKIGGQARSSLQTAVANADRTNGTFDLFGRQLVSHIDPGMQTWKSFNATTTQTGTVVWDPAAGKRIAITSIQIGAYATTAARVILFFNTTTTYTEGTHQPVFKASFAPSSTAKPGAVQSFSPAIFSATADAELRITTDAGISIDVVVYGYEF